MALARLMAVSGWVVAPPQKVLMAFLFAFFPVVISTLGGFGRNPPEFAEHFRAIKASRWTTFWRPVPLLPAIGGGLRFRDAASP